MFSGFSSFGGGFVDIPQKFEEFFRCYPVAMMNDRIRKDDANFGGKIFLPPSALSKLTMLNVRYPMLFELTANENGKVTHGGVLEFIAEEGRAYLPQWMMETLGAQPGSLLKIGSTDLPLGQFVKIQPQSVDFLDITDPKAVLENVLRKFSTLTVDDIIEINYNDNLYRIKVLEVKPDTSSRGVCVIETDLVTDFAPPVGYVEPDYKEIQKRRAEEIRRTKQDPSAHENGSMSRRINYKGMIKEHQKSQSGFAGEGQKLSGKPTNRNEEPEDLSKIKISLNGEPLKLDLPEGQLFFGFPIVLPKGSEEEDTQVNTFQGQGQSLRKSSKRRDKSDHESSKAKAPRSPEAIEID
ncbi:ubiquitin fusion degradation protein [Zygosaccharomyces mellis]|uniref:Ubiquitin fusion degradation protein 1 n=1 Tax=Zygosaccharomyces mellis TaxID=42258 RepID=A0A4C2EAS4_9SACH|nr:ubiquitin fusion degradation protein [Zygosaccharomyces mellis]